MNTETQKVEGTAFTSPEMENAWTLGYTDMLAGGKHDNPYAGDQAVSYNEGYASGHACVYDY